jgi:putative Mg2+ transporter-C (MgtC) family protein
MPLLLTWEQIAIRLLLASIASFIIGLNRDEHGHPAGIRTTMLVCLAATLAMLQVNLLLPLAGKDPSSFVVMDLMRLPLGILTGVGFIGAGVIVRKNELVLGVTTAATLWFATVVGLCIGGGQLVLGSVSTVIGFGVLWGLRYIEYHVERYQLAELKITIQGDRLLPHELRDQLKTAGFQLNSLSFIDCVKEHRRKFDCEVRWPSPRGSFEVPPILAELESLPGVVELEWKASRSGPQ